MDLVFETVLGIIGSGIGFSIARFAYGGYANVGSPTLLRLMVAFASISLGFLLLWARAVQITYDSAEMTPDLLLVGLGFQAAGYFFLAFSHSLQSMTFRHMAPAIALVSLALTPLFVIPGNSIEHIIRSISFILLVYGATQTMTSYIWSKRTSTLLIASGLGLLALGEFVGWYNFIYPGMFYYISMIIKVLGMVAIFVAIYGFRMRRMQLGTSLQDAREDNSGHP